MAIRESRIRTKRYGKRRGSQTERVAPNDTVCSKIRYKAFCSPISHYSDEISRRLWPSQRRGPHGPSSLAEGDTAQIVRTPLLRNIIHDTIRQTWYLNVRRPSTCWLAGRPLGARRYGTRERRNPRPERYTTITTICGIRAHTTKTRRHAERLSARNSLRSSFPPRYPGQASLAMTLKGAWSARSLITAINLYTRG